MKKKPFENFPRIMTAIALAVAIFQFHSVYEASAAGAAVGVINAFAVDLSGAELGNDYGEGSVKAEVSKFTFNYGNKSGHGEAFVKFPVMLPVGTLLSDYETIKFSISSNEELKDKQLALLASPRGAFPESIEFNEGELAASGAVNVLSAELSLNLNAGETASLDKLGLNREEAALIGTRSLEFSIYVRTESEDGSARITISDVELIPADEPIDNAKGKVTSIKLDTDRDSAVITLSRALREGETLTLEAYDSKNMGIGKWVKSGEDFGIFEFEEVKTKKTKKLIAYIYNRKLENRLDFINELIK